MSSESTRKRRRLEAEILRCGAVAVTPCDYCSKQGKTCIVPESSDAENTKSSTRCTECIRRGRECLSSSWQAPDRTRERTLSELDTSLEELSKITAKIEQLRRILRLAETRVETRRMSLHEGVYAQNEQRLQSEQRPSIQLQPFEWDTRSMNDFTWSYDDSLNNQEPVFGRE